MTAETEQTQPPQEGKRIAIPPTEAEERERPMFDLDEFLRARRGKGEGLGVAEAILLMDYQDRQDERRFRRQQAETGAKNPPSPTSNPEIETLKGTVSELRETVGDLLETIRTDRAKKAQEEFVQGVVKQTTDQIMPELEKLRAQLEAYEEKAKTEPVETSELKEIKDSLQNIVDQIGEKVGAKGMTLADVEQLMGIIESLEKRFHKPGEGGEVDYKTMAVSTVGEIGRELITAYREIETSKTTGGTSLEAPKAETPASTMQAIIKRQVQNYITQRMQEGATTLNVQEAAQQLGLTPGQITWAYQTLMKEGWFHVRVPSKGKRKVKETEPVQTGEETSATTQTSEEGEGEQVFNPPVET